MNTKIIPLLIFCFSTHFIVFGQSTNNTDTKPLLKAKIIKGDVFEPKEKTQRGLVEVMDIFLQEI